MMLRLQSEPLIKAAMIQTYALSAVSESSRKLFPRSTWGKNNKGVDLPFSLSDLEDHANDGGAHCGLLVGGSCQHARKVVFLPMLYDTENKVIDEDCGPGRNPREKSISTLGDTSNSADRQTSPSDER